jgi:prevent-host-death family protein
MSTIAVSEARAALSEILDEVEAGGEVTLTRHGKPVAVIIRPDMLRVRRGTSIIEEAGLLRARLVAARTAPKPTIGMTPERAEEYVAQIRADRDAS